MLRPLQDIFQAEDRPDLLVGLSTPDDAAVWRLDDSRALVVTTDFFTPVVDDAYDYGAIAAANALSDLYAMGATPFLALNIVAMPDDLPLDIVSDILRGGAEKVREAGAVLAGGHTIQDPEPKFGLVALGFCDVDQLMTKDRARPGDLIVLTKPLGTGVITTALKREQAAVEHVAGATAWMMRLNGAASRLASALGVRAATDVTGFGMLGHGSELAKASGARLRIHLPAVPFMPGSLDYAMKGCIPGGTLNNQRHFAQQVEFSTTVDKHQQLLLFDAQTSGGLLLCVSEAAHAQFMAQAEREGVPAWTIGLVERGQGISVVDAPFPHSPSCPVEGVIFLQRGGTEA